MAAPKSDAGVDKAPAKTDEEPKPKKRQGVKGIYYLVNPAGAIHSADKDHAKWRLADAGWKLATEQQIAVYLQQPVQRHNSPIAPVWTPDPDEQLAALPGEKELPDAYS